MFIVILSWNNNLLKLGLYDNYVFCYDNFSKILNFIELCFFLLEIYGIGNYIELKLKWWLSIF